MNIDQARQSIYMALCDYTETSLSGDDNAAVRREIEEAWRVLLEHMVAARYGVGRGPMTENQAPLSPHELNTLVRALRPSFAIYEVAQIERMREQCVRAAPVSPDPALRARLQRHEEAIEAVRNLMEDLRAEKLYVYSDRIRGILRDLDQ